MNERQTDGRFPPNAVHVIRTAQQIHALLSQMADQKANILLAATFVIFTIAIGQAHSVAEPLPLLILGGAAFPSAICAILAVMPSFGDSDARKDPNLLFFGSFSAMDEEAFVDTVIDGIRTDESAYRLMARDLYRNGRFLARKKFRLLGYAYRIFLAGLVASGGAFAAQYFFI